MIAPAVGAIIRPASRRRHSPGASSAADSRGHAERRPVGARQRLGPEFGEHLATPLEETRRPTALAEVTWAGETESGPAAPGHLHLPGHDRRIGGEQDLPHRGVDPGLRRSLTARAARHTGTPHRCCREQHGVVLPYEPLHSWGTFPVLYADGITRRRSADECVVLEGDNPAPPGPNVSDEDGGGARWYRWWGSILNNHPDNPNAVITWPSPSRRSWPSAA